MAGMSKYVAAAERGENRARWERELVRWRESGQPMSTWAREQGLSRDALEYWRRKLQDKPARALTLIPVIAPAVPGAGASPAPIELLLGTRRLVLPPGFCGDTLRRAVAVLETC